MGNIIKLFHGTIYEFDKIDVAKGKPFKDYGIGFYTSHDEKTGGRFICPIIGNANRTDEPSPCLRL